MIRVFDILTRVKIARVSSSQEHEQALEIRREVFLVEQKVPKNLEIDEFENECEHFLVTVDGKPVATARLRTTDRFAKFERIATLKAHRGKGYGKRLMEELLKYSWKTYPNLLPLMNAQDSAIGFYEKIGWKGVGEFFIEAGIPHRVLIYPPENPSEKIRETEKSVRNRTPIADK